MTEERHLSLKPRLLGLLVSSSQHHPTQAAGVSLPRWDGMGWNDMENKKGGGFSRPQEHPAPEMGGSLTQNSVVWGGGGSFRTWL